jgi:hypothetical protein
VAPSTAGGGAGSHHGGSTSGSIPSGTSPTSPSPNSGAARTPSASTPGTPSPTGTGPASTPSPTSPTTTPRSTPTPTSDGRVPGTADGRTPGTPDGRIPTQRTPGSTTPGDGTTPRNTPGTTPGDRTPPRNTTPGDGTAPRNTPGNTTPGDRTAPRNTADQTGGTRTHTPGQNPSTTTPNQNPARSTPPRTASSSTSTPTTTPSTSTGTGSERTSTPSSGTPNSATPSSGTPNSSNQPGPASSPTTQGSPGTAGTHNQPGTGTGSTPARPPQQPAGSTPSTPNAPQQPAAQPNTPPQNTPPINPQQHQHQQVTAVPVHTVIRTPSSAASPSHAGPATPHPPGSPQSDPGVPKDQQHPQQDSLQDIRADLDHYPGGLSDPDPDDQQALADAVPHNEDGTPERFPDPFGSWSQLQNDGGNTVPGRSNNCADCSRSFLETWYGNPQVSAPRTLDTDEHGNLDPWSPESNANENQIRWTGAAHAYAGPGNDPDTANNIASVLQESGPGSAAIVQVDWPGGGGHAFNVVNHDGNIVWIDTQSGEVSNQPLHIDNAEHVWHIPLDADRNPIDLTQSDTDDSESQNDESQNQNDDASQPENSENDGQPQNDVSGDDTDTGVNSPKAADSATPDASNNADPAQPSTADPNTSPDPTNGEPENETGRPQGESNKPSEPDSTSDGREPSQATPDNRQPSPAETPSTPDQQSRPDEAPHPDEQGRTPDKESEQPTATTESPARHDSPSEHGDRPTHTTPDNADNGTADKSTPPTRAATDTPNDPTTNRDTPQQTTDPRPTDPRATDPRTADPRTTDPRTSDPRTSDPRTSDPHRDTPTQKKPDADGRPDGQRPNTPPRPDQARTDHVDDPRSETPDKDRSETPDQTRPDDPTQSPVDDHRDRPSEMTKDSAIPKRESLPDGKNADAANYVKDSVNGKKPLYGDIAAENPTRTSGPTHPERPSGPAEPAGDGSRDLSNPAQRRERDLEMLARANSKDPKDKAWFEKYYHPKSGYRRSRTDPAEDGQPVPQLHPTDDPDKPWMLANDAPDAERESYIDSGTEHGDREKGISDDNLKVLDKAAKDRHDAIAADKQPHRDRKAAKDTYDADKSPENKKKFDEADAKHSPLHGKMTRSSEDYGEQVAEFHAMPEHFGDYERIDDRATGNNRFDQIWTIPDSDPPQYVVVEAKGSLTAELGERRGLPPENSGQPAPSNEPATQVNDGEQNDDSPELDDPRPGVPKVRQGTRDYFKTILHEMEARSDRILADPTKSEAEQLAALEEAKLAQDLAAALEDGRVTYVLVKGDGDGGQHNGYEMKQFDIRTPEEKERDNAADPEA